MNTPCNYRTHMSQQFSEKPVLCGQSLHICMESSVVFVFLVSKTLNNNLIQNVIDFVQLQGQKFVVEHKLRILL